jgi:hypothetical protein
MTIKRALRKFTDKGIAQFRGYLADLRDGATSPPPFDLLVDPVASKPVKGQLQIENRKFATRLELARYLDEALGDLNYDLYSMTGEEVLQLLPAEFNKWKK